MRLIKELTHSEIAKLDARTATYKVRRAARAVLVNDKGEVALMNVSKHGYYKLPGGGIENDEDIVTALAREIKEEVGATAEVTDELGMIIEYRPSKHLTKTEGHNLTQISFCYIARLVSDGENNLDEGEVRDGFRAEWHPIEKAIELVKNSKPNMDDEYTARVGHSIIERDSSFLIEYKSRKHKAKLAGGVVLVRTRNGKEELLLQKRGHDAPGAGNWDATAGGHVDSENESLTMTAHREALEEIGITFDERDALFTTVVHAKTPVGQYVELFYFIDKYKGEVKICEKTKLEKLEWFPVDNLPKNLWPTPTIAALDNFKKRLAYSEIGFTGGKQ